MNHSAAIFFGLFVSITLVITYWASRRTRSASHFYTAGGGITGLQNGLALAGDYMSAASFLGIAGMVSLRGFDGLMYSIGFFVGWPIVMFLIAEPLRNLGKYTFADVVAYRLSQKPVRVAASLGALSVILVYLTAQMVGAGDLVHLLFPEISYTHAVIAVGFAMLIYVFFGGMAATTWVQIIKACLLLGGALVMALWVLSKFHFNPLALFTDASKTATDSAPDSDRVTVEAARKAGTALPKQAPPPNVFGPVSQVTNTADALSLGLALMFGTAGLPHILMRFYTVPDARTARTSVGYATAFIGFFYLLTFILGFGAMALVGQVAIFEQSGKGGNMAAPLLAKTLGGDPFLGFISAVAFATILAVVAGLALSGAATLSHDLWVNVVRHGKANDAEEFKVARVATVCLAAAAIGLGIKFHGQNVAYMVGLAFAIAASGNFPALLMSMTWKRFTTAGAVSSMVCGGVSAVVLIILSPLIWVDIMKHPAAIFPLKNPALVSMPLAFAVGIIVSLMWREPDAEAKFEAATRRMHLGDTHS